MKAAQSDKHVFNLCPVVNTQCSLCLDFLPNLIWVSNTLFSLKLKSMDSHKPPTLFMQFNPLKPRTDLQCTKAAHTRAYNQTTGIMSTHRSPLRAETVRSLAHTFILKRPSTSVIISAALSLIKYLCGFQTCLFPHYKNLPFITAAALARMAKAHWEADKGKGRKDRLMVKD